MPAKKNGKYYQSTFDATTKYQAKTYDKITILLRKEEDADIIKYIRDAQNEGKSSREWLRDLFRGGDPEDDAE